MWPESLTDALRAIGTNYSDCTIRCGETHAVHRIVLHIHSPVFAQKFEERSARGEGMDTELNLEHEDPNAMRAMLHFFYNKTYDTPNPTTASPASPTSALAFHLDVFQIAHTFKSQTLKDLARSKFNEELYRGSWSARELYEAVSKLYQRIDTPGASSLRDELLKVMQDCSTELFDTREFMGFMTTYPEWALRLLKIYDPKFHPLETQEEEGFDGEAPAGNSSGGGAGGDSTAGNASPGVGADESSSEDEGSLSTDNATPDADSAFLGVGKRVGGGSERNLTAIAKAAQRNPAGERLQNLTLLQKLGGGSA